MELFKDRMEKEMCFNVAALYGVPRSGTSWLGGIFDSCPYIIYRFQPLFSYRFKNGITTESTEMEIKSFFNEMLYEDQDVFINQKNKKENGTYPLFDKVERNVSTLFYKETRYLYTIPLLLERCDNIRIIAIIRNPYDVLESWINAPSEFKKDWNIDEEWYFAGQKNKYMPENYFGYSKWKEYLSMCIDMREKFPSRFTVVRYEDLRENTLEVVQYLFSFVGVPFTAQTSSFITASQSSTSKDAYSIYREKGKTSEKNLYLTKNIKEKIKRDLEDFIPAKKFGYS